MTCQQVQQQPTQLASLGLGRQPVRFPTTGFPNWIKRSKLSAVLCELHT